MKTDPNIVVVDYNHRGVSTGSYLRNLRVEKNYKLENGDVLEEALVGDIHIPKDAEMFFHDKEGIKRSNGNLYEAVNKGQIQSVSVEFRPYKGKQITDTKTGITTYREWDLLKLSLLDVVAGQPYSGFKIIRSLIQNNQNMSLDNIKTALANGDVNKEDLMALCMPVENQTPNTSREIEIEVSDQTPVSTETTDIPAEADVNNDGEITEEEARAYIKEIKRALGDNPSMVTDKIAEIERKCGELEKRLNENTRSETEDIKDDTTIIETTETNTDTEELEAQRIRALKDNLTEVKEITKSDASVVRQLGSDEAKSMIDEDLEAKRQKTLQLNNYNIYD
jgi:hypothetical protein